MIVSGRYLDNTIKYNITNTYNINNTQYTRGVSGEWQEIGCIREMSPGGAEPNTATQPTIASRDELYPANIGLCSAVTFTLWHVRDPCLGVHLQMLPVSSSNTNKCLAEVFYLKKFRFLNYSYYNILQFASWSGSLHFSLRQFYDWMTEWLDPFSILSWFWV